MNSAAVVNRYLEAFYSANFGEARDQVADDFVFEGPFVSTQGKEKFFTAASGLMSVLRGHRVVNQLAKGDQVVSLIEVSLESQDTQGSVLMTEWHKIAEGRLKEGKVVFDTAAFRKIVPAR